MKSGCKLEWVVGWSWPWPLPLVPCPSVRPPGRVATAAAPCPLQRPTQALGHFLSSRTCPGLRAPGRRQLIRGERTLCSGLAICLGWGCPAQGLAGRAGHCMQEDPSEQIGMKAREGQMSKSLCPGPCQDLGLGPSQRSTQALPSPPPFYRLSIHFLLL